MTKAEIMAMEPGEKLDELIGKAFGYTPKIKWYAMDADETSYYMVFDIQSKADEWHNAKVRHSPYGRYINDGGHIVRKEIYNRFSEDISAAWELRERIHHTIGGTKIISVCDDFPEMCEIWNGKFYIRAQALTVPEAICKAALLAAREVQG